MREWDDPDVPQPERSAAELVAGMDAPWQFMKDRLDRWTPDDMAKTFPHDDPAWRDRYVTSRSWVVWHVLEHDLHHGGGNLMDSRDPKTPSPGTLMDPEVPRAAVG